MSSIAYATGIVTLAAWLSVVSIGGTGMWLTSGYDLPAREESKDPFHDIEAVLLTDDFTGPEEISQEATDTGTTGEAADAEVPYAPEETLPEPPELADQEDVEPLPEVPALPAPRPDPQPRPKPKPTPRKIQRLTKPVSKTGGSPHGSQTARGTVGAGGRKGGTGMSDAKRLGGGRMPPPVYPASARRAGHTGTVVVEFIVGGNGSVISAYAKRSCPWPELNEAALKAVRRWRFPASGATSKFIRPITFQLN